MGPFKIMFRIQSVSSFLKIMTQQFWKILSHYIFKYLYLIFSILFLETLLSVSNSIDSIVGVF